MLLTLTQTEHPLVRAGPRLDRHRAAFGGGRAGYTSRSGSGGAINHQLAPG